MNTKTSTQVQVHDAVSGDFLMTEKGLIEIEGVAVALNTGNQHFVLVNGEHYFCWLGATVTRKV